MYLDDLYGLIEDLSSKIAMILVTNTFLFGNVIMIVNQKLRGKNPDK